MTDNEDDEAALQWPAAAFAEQMQQMTEQSADAQAEMYNQLLSATTGIDTDGLTPLNSTWSGMATFKTRIQSNGRLSIPDTEREALDIEEGDIVQTIVIPVKRNRSE